MLTIGEALRRGGRGALVALSMAALVACSDSDEPAANQPPPPPEKLLLSSVTSIDFGRTFDGVVILVEGVAPALGYQQPELRNHAGGARSADGFAQFDLVGIPPTEDVVETLPQPGGENALRMTVQRELPTIALSGVVGVRVYAARGVLSRRFQPQPPPTTEP